MSFILKELRVNGVENLSPLRLPFKKHLVSVLECPEKMCPPSVRHVLCTALQLICGGAKTSEIDSKFQQACVRLIFLTRKENQPSLQQRQESKVSTADDNMPSTSAQSKQAAAAGATGETVSEYDTIHVKRDFKLDHGRNVQYTINSDAATLLECPWLEFCKKFFTDVDTILPNLRELQPLPTMAANKVPWQRGNWMQLLATNFSEAKAKQLLQRFVEMSQEANITATSQNPNFDLLSKMTTSCLLLLTAMEIIQKAQICKILSDVRRIFEYITCHEYTVWFLIPVHGEITCLTSATESFDFENLITRIQRTNEALTMRTYIWKHVDHVLQDLLIVAFQMGFGYHCKQHIVYLQQLDRIASRQAFNMALAATLKCSNPNARYENYIQRIINVCHKINLTAVIEYSAGLPFKPINANFIKCRNDPRKGTVLYVDN